VISWQAVTGRAQGGHPLFQILVTLWAFVVDEVAGQEDEVEGREGSGDQIQNQIQGLARSLTEQATFLVGVQVGIGQLQHLKRIGAVFEVVSTPGGHRSAFQMASEQARALADPCDSLVQ
jgi:hypothetical protein